MDTAIVPSDVDGLIVWLEQGQTALAHCLTNFARMDVRDIASRAKVAAALMDRLDIVMNAGFLMARAERAIYDATPKHQGAPLGLDPNSELPPNVLPEIRKANNHVSDREFEKFLKDRKKIGRPWTRQAQIEYALWRKSLEPRRPPRKKKPVAPDKPMSIADEIETISALDDVPKPLPEPVLLAGRHTMPDLAKQLKEIIKAIDACDAGLQGDISLRISFVDADDV